jgi:hypothetical protein
MRKRKYSEVALPDALWLEVVSYFDVQDVRRVVLCSKQLRSLGLSWISRQLINIFVYQDLAWIYHFLNNIRLLQTNDFFRCLTPYHLLKVREIEISSADLSDETIWSCPLLTKLKIGKLSGSSHLKFECQPSLEILEIERLSLGFKDVMYSARVTFPKLAQLVFTGMHYMCLPNLQSLRTLIVNEQNTPELGPQTLSNLAVFKLKNCPTVASLVNLQFPSLEHLVIENCPNLSISSRNNFPALQTITIVRASIMQRSQSNASQDMHWSYSPEDDTLTGFRR